MLTTLQLGDMSPTQCISHIHQFFPEALAATTYKKYMGIAVRLDQFAMDHKMLPWEHHTMSSWVISTKVKPQGQMSYNKVCSALLKLRARLLTDSLSLHRKNLDGQGALIPITQANPIPLSALDHPALQPHRLAVLLAWSSASRWDEIHKLTKENFILISPEEIIIDWFVGTKSSRTDPFRASRFTVLTGQFTREICTLLQPLSQKAPVTLLTTTHIAHLLKRVGDYSGHSFKAGAVDVVTRSLPPGLNSELMLSRIAKHAHPLDLPQTTCRYPRDQIALARFLGTQTLTKFL